MHALVVFLISIAPAYAATEIEVKVVHEYSENRTHLYQNGGKWFCDTELQKELELEGEAASPGLFPAGKKMPDAECGSRFYGLKISGKKMTKWEGCAADPAVKPFLKALNRECGR